MTPYIPFFSKSAWNKVPIKEKHSGLALYRFFIGDESGKNDSLKSICKTTAPEKAQVLVNRQTDHLTALSARGYSVCQFEMITSSRLVCGLGIPSCAKNGLFMDRIWGIPYLSGSGLKGIAQDQSLISLDAFFDVNDRRDKKRHHSIFIAMFGPQSGEKGQILDRYWKAGKGAVVFLDAVPILHPNTEPYEMDIVNPHYNNYYSSGGGEPPGDYQSPIPSFFITVRRNITFSFAIAAKNVHLDLKNNGIKEPAGNYLCDQASKWLQTALMELGIGGKTRIDYGYFR